MRLKPYTAAIDSLQEIKTHRADVFTVMGQSFLDSLDADDIKAASLLQRVTAMGILYDKERLERGQSTANVGIADYTRRIQDIDAECNRLLASLGLSPTNLSQDMFDSAEEGP